MGPIATIDKSVEDVFAVSVDQIVNVAENSTIARNQLCWSEMEEVLSGEADG